MAELDPALATLLAEMRAAGLPAYETMLPVEARRVAELRNSVWNIEPLPLEEVRELEIEGPRGPLRLRLYVPPEAPTPGPAVLFLHGGGWLLCSIDTHDNIARRLALAGGVRVVSIDYGLAPEHPYPAGLTDALAAIRWFARNGAAEGIDPTRLALAGDSAGANLALACCLDLRDRGQALVRAAALVYGVYSADHESPSHLAFGGGDYVLTSSAMRWFWQHYVPEPRRRSEPLAAPLHADLTGLPALYLTAAEFDPLRDDTERLARRLIEARVDFDFRLWRGMTHAVLNWSRRVPRVDALIADLAAFLARHLQARP
jgi:acetyl esterase